MTDERASLLLVEDDLQLGPLMVQVLSEIYRVDLVDSGEAALEAALHGQFDVIVTDRRLPGMDGVALAAAIRRAHITTPILMLTALGTLDDKVSGLDGGANDYMVKPFDFDELFARLRALRRGYGAATASLPAGDWNFQPDTLTMVSQYQSRVTLSPTEAALVELLARDPDRVFSRGDILSVVFGGEGNPGTVDTYVHYVRRKTDHSVIETVRSLGYRIGR